MEKMRALLFVTHMMLLQCTKTVRVFQLGVRRKCARSSKSPRCAAMFIPFKPMQRLKL